MPLDPEERKARKREQNRASAKVRRALQAGVIAAPPPHGPRLTADPSKASRIRMASGKAVPIQEARKWSKQSF